MRRLINWLCFHAVLHWPKNYDKPLSKAYCWALARAGEYAF